MSYELQKAFEQYLRIEKGMRETTISSYMRDIRYFSLFFTARSLHLEALTEDDVKSFVQYLHTLELSPYTIARKTAALKAFLNYLAACHGYTNHAQIVHFPKIRKKIPYEGVAHLEVMQLRKVYDKKHPRS